MKNLSLFFLSACILIVSEPPNCLAQLTLEPSDPAKQTDIPDFYKGTLTDIDRALSTVKKGRVAQIAVSAGGLPLYAVYYGAKEDFARQANYNSAVGARNPAYYAKKGAAAKPVIYFIGPVHGQEAEGIVGLVNLLAIAETGKDLRGKAWPELSEMFGTARVVIVPTGNPDGRRRVPYDSFVGLPEETMTKYGQGTKKDGTLWRWPQAKSLHPMRGDVGILGAYYNDAGINIMHDEFFAPMAEETKAIMRIAMEEAPDITVSLHSCSCAPFVIQNAHAPLFMKERIDAFARQLNDQYRALQLPNRGASWKLSTEADDPTFPPQNSFNLVSALHHASGTMAFTFESPHGTVEDGATYEQILDIQLVLYQEMFRYISAERLIWQ
ncbi:hypothetical protein ADIS_1289 [Lunatimonas lonarensis]|uniref:Peptidase M14 carboxypeptidase A domain-containing protein n=1 Tax=Lunatimonas lonarensis TaxID=1232681 RepID=R7ZVK0_9BACT|nr:hypothetical protein [Lunatimonas lonarensis]EON78092.1 hypothetical protein ADIS_1289 [Lunatimonas lonarensis]